MPAFRSPPLSVLRAVTVVLLLLGIVLNPVLAYVGDIHERGHGSEASASAADHQHRGDTAADAGDDAQDRAADVWHGFMHVGHGHGASTPAFLLPKIAAVAQNHAVAFPPTAPMTPLQHLAGPFRPPIR